MPISLKQTLDLALQQHQAGRFFEAEANYRLALMIRPDYPDALHLLGLALHQTDRNELALVEIRRAIALRPNTAEFYTSLAAVCLALEQPDPAVAAGRRAVELKPQLPEAWLNLGNALAMAKQREQAIESYHRAIQLRPRYAQASAGLGNVLVELKQFDQAVLAYREAIGGDPGFVDAHYNLGNAFVAQENFEPALACYRQALALKPDHLGAINNFASALSRSGKLEDALSFLRQAIAKHPKTARLHSNLGNMLGEANRLTEALDCYHQALRVQPDFHGARFNLAIALLALGDFENGWAEYECRWLCKDFPSPLRFADKPLWLGEPLNGRRILLHFEQGFGDTLQFIRFVPLVAARGGPVILQVQAPLLRLLRHTPGASEVTCDPVAGDRFDVQCPLWSLPLALKTTVATIPPVAPGLFVDPEQRRRWRERIDDMRLPGHRLNIGLVWAGSPQHPHDYRRSIKLSQFAPLAKAAGITFFSLQKGPAAAQAENPPAGMRLVDWSAELNDFADTAALISELDLTICIDTGVAHLAASLGKPTWILLMFPPDFRWLRDRDDSPWYPSARLFLQPSNGDWESPILRMAEELGRLGEG